jgi:hypothetical protein
VRVGVRALRVDGRVVQLRGPLVGGRLLAVDALGVRRIRVASLLLSGLLALEGMLLALGCALFALPCPFSQLGIIHMGLHCP